MSHLNAEEIRKLDSLISAAVSMKERHKVESDGVKDAVKALSEETGLKAKSINRAIARAYKADQTEEEEFLEEVTTILEATGRL